MWYYPLIKKGLNTLLLVLVDTTPESPYLLVANTRFNFLLAERSLPTVSNTDMHSSTAQTGNSLVLIKHLAAQALPSQITKSILDLNYLEDDTVWHFLCLQTRMDFKRYF